MIRGFGYLKLQKILKSLSETRPKSTNKRINNK